MIFILATIGWQMIDEGREVIGEVEKNDTSSAETMKSLYHRPISYSTHTSPIAIAQNDVVARKFHMLLSTSLPSALTDRVHISITRRTTEFYIFRITKQPNRIVTKATQN